jgi:hypothetical protein
MAWLNALDPLSIVNIKPYSSKLKKGGLGKLDEGYLFVSYYRCVRTIAHY